MKTTLYKTKKSKKSIKKNNNTEYSIEIDSSESIEISYDSENDDIETIIDKIINRKKYLEKIVSDEEKDFYKDCKKYQ